MYGKVTGWYGLLERVSKRSLSSEEAVELAVCSRKTDGDSRWALPLAMAHWLEDRYSDALACLLEPSVVQASDSLWVYHNLVGMVARKLAGETERAARAYERSLELDPNRADTL